MDTTAILALIADLYSQARALRQENERLKLELAKRPAGPAASETP